MTKQTSNKLSKRVNDLNYILRNSCAAKLQAVAVNLPKLKLLNGYLSKILTFQNIDAVEYSFNSVPKGKWGVMKMLQSLFPPSLLRTTSNLPKIL